MAKECKRDLPMSFTGPVIIGGLIIICNVVTVNYNHKMVLFSSVFCRCVSKKESFAPGTMYKPFGKEVAGTMTLSQFQTLHEKDQETASLRELGLNETEILIWKSHVSGEKVKKSSFLKRMYLFSFMYVCACVVKIPSLQDP